MIFTWDIIERANEWRFFSTNDGRCAKKIQIVQKIINYTKDVLSVCTCQLLYF